MILFYEQEPFLIYQNYIPLMLFITMLSRSVICLPDGYLILFRIICFPVLNEAMYKE